MKIDWKFTSTLVLTIVSVAVPVWLWQADIDAKSLSMSIVSTVPIGGTQPGPLSGVQVTVDGIVAESPYVSLLEIRSSGRRSIAASDFESPLEIGVQEGTRLLKVQVKESFPADLRPSSTIKDGQLLIAPMLLNAGDRFQLAVVSSGPLPTYSIRSRIAGIQSVSVVDSRSTLVQRRTILMRVVGVILLVVYFLVGLPAISAARRGALRPISLVAATACAIGGSLLVVIPVPTGEVSPFDSATWFGVAIVAGTVSAIVQRKLQSAA